ncbi:hypothetical protein [Bacteriovorax sp. Seq25_V]|uniref:hypothetical protein n=1 Tax=Bacteriovorax sp. Seq25_V TaxID=1201288 RepID=UPI00038A23A7|nr:hypothetical protein [Bacteriovorax sp. Seq25_V]EQC45470.1 putative lipoprotein [Bacteriovorax sp. Seq25_V]
MKKITLAFSVLLIIASCSNLTKNMVKSGDFSIRSGAMGSKEWDETLKFNRVSWFHELTMLYDLVYTKIDEKSAFYNWFDNDEKRRISNCNEKLITLSYYLDSSRISHTMVKNKLLDQGYEEYSVPNFTRALKTHPDFEKLSLQLYKVNLYCHKSKANAEIYIDFPNFEKIKL